LLESNTVTANFRLPVLAYQKRPKGQVTPLFHSPILAFAQLDLTALSFQLPLFLASFCFELSAISFELPYALRHRPILLLQGYPCKPIVIRDADKALHFVLLGMICHLTSVKKGRPHPFYFRQF